MSERNNNVTPLLVSAQDAAGLLGISQRAFYSLLSSGRIGPLPIHLGRRTLWRRNELESWIQAGCPARQQWLSEKSLQPSRGNI